MQYPWSILIPTSCTTLAQQIKIGLPNRPKLPKREIGDDRMSMETYRKLVDEICTLTNIQKSELLYQSMDLQVKGVNFSMFYWKEISPDYGVVYCDFGPLPSENREAVLLRLLQTNLYLFGINTPSFAIDRQTNHVLMAINIPLEKTTAEHVVLALSDFAELALGWRVGYFLTEEEEHSGVVTGEKSSSSKSTLNRFTSQFSKPSTPVSSHK
jgi:hypothetical protein